MFASKKAWLCWTLAVSYVILIFGFQTGYAVINPKISETLGLSATEMSLISATYTFFFVFFQIFSGSILDKTGVKPAIPLACLFLTMGLVLFVFSKSLWGFVLAQIFVALGGSFGFIGAGFVGRIWFPSEKYGLMFSWVQFVASVSACLIQLVFIKVLEHLPWNDVVIGFSILGGAMILLMTILLDNPKELNFQPLRIETARTVIKGCIVDLLKIIRRKKVLFIMLIGAVSFGSMLSFSIVWGSRLLQSYGISQNQAHVAVAMSWLELAIGSPLFSYISNFLRSNAKALGIGLIGQTVTLAILVCLQTNAWQSTFLLFLFGIFTGASMLPFAIAASLVDTNQVGTSAALVNGSQFLFGAILVSIPGYLLNLSPAASMRQILLPVFFVLLATTSCYILLGKKAAK